MRAAYVVIAFAALATVAMTAGCMPDSFVITPISSDKPLEQKLLYRESILPDGAVAVVTVDGVLINAKRTGILSPGEHPVAELLEQLDAARRDPLVKAVVLRINSPGGTVTASEMMHNEITEFKKTGKPVIAMMMDVAASGGYYVACAADEILAHESTVTGSIGVLMQLFEVTETMRMIGVKGDTIKSGDQKAAGSPFETLEPEQRVVFQKVIDELYGQFIDVVAKGRPKLSRETIVRLADGRIYTAPQALEAGLIDHIATMRDAIETAKKRAGIKRAKVIRYERPYVSAGNYYASHPGSDPQMQVNLLNLDLGGFGQASRAPFMYLWRPH